MKKQRVAVTCFVLIVAMFAGFSLFNDASITGNVVREQKDGPDAYQYVKSINELNSLSEGKYAIKNWQVYYDDSGSLAPIYVIIENDAFRNGILEVSSDGYFRFKVGNDNDALKDNVQSFNSITGAVSGMERVTGFASVFDGGYAYDKRNILNQVIRDASGKFLGVRPVGGTNAQMVSDPDPNNYFTQKLPSFRTVDGTIRIVEPGNKFGRIEIKSETTTGLLKIPNVYELYRGVDGSVYAKSEDGTVVDFPFREESFDLSRWDKNFQWSRYQSPGFTTLLVDGKISYSYSALQNSLEVPSSNLFLPPIQRGPVTFGALKTEQIAKNTPQSQTASTPSPSQYEQKCLSNGECTISYKYNEDKSATAADVFSSWLYNTNKGESIKPDDVTRLNRDFDFKIGDYNAKLAHDPVTGKHQFFKTQDLNDEGKGFFIPKPNAERIKMVGDTDIKFALSEQVMNGGLENVKPAKPTTPAANPAVGGATTPQIDPALTIQYQKQIDDYIKQFDGKSNDWNLDAQGKLVCVNANGCALLIKDENGKAIDAIYYLKGEGFPPGGSSDPTKKDANIYALKKSTTVTDPETIDPVGFNKGATDWAIKYANAEFLYTGSSTYALTKQADGTTKIEKLVEGNVVESYIVPTSLASKIDKERLQKEGTTDKGIPMQGGTYLKGGAEGYYETKYQTFYIQDGKMISSENYGKLSNEEKERIGGTAYTVPTSMIGTKTKEKNSQEFILKFNTELSKDGKFITTYSGFIIDKSTGKQVGFVHGSGDNPADPASRVTLTKENGLNFWDVFSGSSSFKCSSDDKTKCDQAISELRPKLSAQFFASAEKILTEYQGLSYIPTLFMSDDSLLKWRDSVDRIFATFYLGTEYWSSKICGQYIDGESEGIAFAETPQGLAQVGAHIEATRTPPIYNGETYEYIYKITFAVRNGDYDKDPRAPSTMHVNVVLKGDSTANVFKQDIEIKRGSQIKRSGTSAIVKDSRNFYSEVCLTFDEVPLRWKISGDELCNTIVESGSEPSALGGSSPSSPQPSGSGGELNDF